MKTIPIAEWRYKNIDDDVVMRFGYRANEMGRAKRMMEKTNDNGMTEVKIVVGKHNNGNNKWKTIEYCKPEFPLIDAHLFKDTIEEYWKDKPIRFAYMNNCVGCWWRSPMLLSHMSARHPEKMDWFARQEEDNKGRFKSEVSYREIMNYKTQFQLFDDDFNECDSGYCGL
jgi:hypothetical protein